MSCATTRPRLPVFATITSQFVSEAAYQAGIRTLVEKLAQQRETFEETTCCVVCMSAPRDVGFLHDDGVCVVACQGCATDIAARGMNCPQCQRASGIVIPVRS